VALVGRETTLIDASPDIEFQLEREGIRQIDRIFITHWHFDHVGGLGALGLPSSIARWPGIEIYMPYQVAHHFDEDLAYMKHRVNLHLIKPGDTFELPDATWEVVKTTHTEESVGFLVESSLKLGYLVDGIEPPRETAQRLEEVDLLILDAIADELVPREGEVWFHFSLQQAVDFWKKVGTRECILTHLSCHSWNAGRLSPGLSSSERLEYQASMPGLRFAYDGMRLKV